MLTDNTDPEDEEGKEKEKTITTPTPKAVKNPEVVDVAKPEYGC